jgi:hypothetical protein
LHRELYGETPEQEVLNTGNGALLIQSVAALGIVEPILGLEAEEDDETGAQPGDVLVLAGWRRVIAARVCGIAAVPVRLVDPTAVPRAADVDLIVVSANLQRQKTIAEIRNEIQVWKRALSQASGRPLRAWELRVAVAKVLGVSVQVVRQADSFAATQRLAAAERELGPVPSVEPIPELLPAPSDDIDVYTLLHREQQPGDLRGSDILSALQERGEALLSAHRDEVVHESIDRAAQIADGISVLDLREASPLWPRDLDRSGEDAPTARASRPPAAAADRQVVPSPVIPDRPTLALVPTVHRLDEPVLVPERKLTVHQGGPDTLPFASLPSVDLIIAAPSWVEPLVRPYLTPPHVTFTADWDDKLHRCLVAWRKAIRPGGRLLLILPTATPLYPGLPVLSAAVESIRATEWAIGGGIALQDSGLRGPAYAVPHPDQVMAPKAPVRLIVAAAPVALDATGTREERWRNAWAAPLPGRLPRSVAAVEEAALNHLWRYAGPGPRSRWLPEFQPGLLYHLVRIFSRPDATVFLPELGGANFVRGCIRTGRQVVALAEHGSQIADVADRIRRDPDPRPGAGERRETIAAVTGLREKLEDEDDG